MTSTILHFKMACLKYFRTASPLQSLLVWVTLHFILITKKNLIDVIELYFVLVTSHVINISTLLQYQKTKFYATSFFFKNQFQFFFSFSLRQHGTGIWKLNTETGSLEQVKGKKVFLKINDFLKKHVQVLTLAGCGDTAFPSIVRLFHVKHIKPARSQNF